MPTQTLERPVPATAEEPGNQNQGGNGTLLVVLLILAGLAAAASWAASKFFPSTPEDPRAIYTPAQIAEAKDAYWIQKVAASHPEQGEEYWEKFYPTKRELEELEKLYNDPEDQKFWEWVRRYFSEPSVFSLEVRSRHVSRALAEWRCQRGDCAGMARVINLMLKEGAQQTVCGILSDMQEAGCCPKTVAELLETARCEEMWDFEEYSY